jgi:2-methylisocitrate lyase-like PEP mutase family enzyme
MTAMTTTFMQDVSRLHESGCFVIPNPWDIGSARLLVQLGFRHWRRPAPGSRGRRAADNAVYARRCARSFQAIAASVDCPVNGDFEGGFAIEPAGVAATSPRAIATGIAGVSIEDSTGDASNPFSTSICPSNASMRRAGNRSQRHASAAHRPLGGLSSSAVPILKETIRRITAYAEAGADCLYAPGFAITTDIIAVVKAVRRNPSTFSSAADFATSEQLDEDGCAPHQRRWGTGARGVDRFLTAATEIAKQGTFKTLGEAVPFANVNSLFGPRRD